MRHAASLWNALREHDHTWIYIPDGPFANEAAFLVWLDSRISRDDPYCYAIVDLQGRTLGISALMEIRPAMRVIEVGLIVLAPALQRTPLATEAQYLLARYAFEELGNRRYEWKCYSLNAPSRRAALRFGFTFEGILRQHMIVKGRSRDTAYFSMLEAEWPARKRAFERWLAEENFDAQGKQKASLTSLRED
jgi:RimJ/RimL family protein N-acetyltransferase